MYFKIVVALQQNLTGYLKI